MEQAELTVLQARTQMPQPVHVAVIGKEFADRYFTLPLGQFVGDILHRVLQLGVFSSYFLCYYLLSLV